MTNQVDTFVFLINLKIFTLPLESSLDDLQNRMIINDRVSLSRRALESMSEFLSFAPNCVKCKITKTVFIASYITTLRDDVV